MKKYFRILMVSSFVLPVFSLATVSALSNPFTYISSNKTTTTETQSEGTSSEISTTSSEDESQGRPERIAKHKAEMKTKQTTVQQKRVQSVCKSAQGKATSTQEKVKGLETSRNKVYKNLINRLTEVSTKLEAKGVDTTELQTEITNLQAQISTFKTDLTDYKLAVGDLVAVDCAGDPVGFQASLEAARVQRDKLLQESTAIKTYVNSTVKPTLKKLRDQVAKTESETETTKPEGN